MDVVNFPGILAQYGLLKPGDIITQDDLILIGKKVNSLRNGSQYQELAMTIQDFLSMTGGGSGPATFCSITMQPTATLGTVINFVHPNGTGNTVFDSISPFVSLTRNNSGCLYNLVVEASCFSIGPEPSDTEWLWIQAPIVDYGTVVGLTYQPLQDIVYNDLPCGGFTCIPGESFIMHDILDDKYYIIEFLTWKSGGSGGGFSYNRTPITIVCDGCIHFSDGSTICTGNNKIDVSNFYVDNLFGDDSTALPNRFDKPFRSVVTAATQAVAYSNSTNLRSLVYVRAGDYTGPGSGGAVALGKKMDMYFEPSSHPDLYFTDAGNSISECTVKGYGRFTLDIPVPFIGIQGGDYKDFIFECDTIETFKKNIVEITSFGASPESILTVKGNTFKTNSGAGYAIFADVAASITFNFNSGIVEDGFLFLRESTGVYNINVPNLEVRGPEHVNHLRSKAGITTILNYNGNILCTNPNYTGDEAVFMLESGQVIIRGNIRAPKKIGLATGGTQNNVGSFVKMYGDIVVEAEAIIASNRNQPIFMQQSYLSSAGAGPTSKQVVSLGFAFAGYPSFPGLVYVKDCRIFNSRSGEAAVLYFDLNSVMSLYDTEIEMVANLITTFAVFNPGGATPGCKDVASNAAIGATIIDNFSPSGFTLVAGLTIPKF